jgi:hypothetical protein
MNILFIIISIILILILFTSKKKEFMTDIVPYRNNLDGIPDLNTKCCLIEKKYLQDDNSINRGDFKYIYAIKQNEECDPSNYELNNNKQLLIDKVNNWSNNKCNNNDSDLRSCRIMNNECIDFVDKPFCDKVQGMIWSDKTCHNPLDFIWQDKIIRNIPEIDKKNDGSYEMFPEKFKKL